MKNKSKDHRSSEPEKILNGNKIDKKVLTFSFFGFFVFFLPLQISDQWLSLRLMIVETNGASTTVAGMTALNSVKISEVFFDWMDKRFLLTSIKKIPVLCNSFPVSKVPNLWQYTIALKYDSDGSDD